MQIQDKSEVKHKSSLKSPHHGSGVITRDPLFTAVNYPCEKLVEVCRTHNYDDFKMRRGGKKRIAQAEPREQHEREEAPPHWRDMQLIRAVTKASFNY